MDVEGMQTDFCGFCRDTLAFKVQELARVEDCRIVSLSAHAQNLRFHSGDVRNLHLDLDGIADWRVNKDSFHIDTEHLSGSGNRRNYLQKGECRRVLWTPKSKDASLDVVLRQAARIEMD